MTFSMCFWAKWAKTFKIMGKNVLKGSKNV